MKSRVIFVGPVNRENIPSGGQIAKCQFIVDYFERHGIDYKLIDSYGKNKIVLMLKVLIESIKDRKSNLLIHLGSKSALYLSLGLLLTFSLNRTGYMVVGNWFPVFLGNNKYLKYIYNSFRFISIEGDRSAIRLKELGLDHVMAFPHFKKIYDLNNRKEIFSNDQFKVVKILFLARVCTDKGVDIAIAAIKRLNDLIGNKCVVKLDIYGNIDSNYLTEFNDELNKHDYVYYKGLIDLNSIDGYKKLAQEGYYVMVFPTKYIGEGFAGTFVDSMILGLPVIASDWNLNSEVIVNGNHGVIIKKNTSEFLVNALLKLIESPVLRNMMAQNQYERRYSYDVDNVMNCILRQYC